MKTKTENKTCSEYEWQLLQAISHLSQAIELAPDPHKAHLLQSAMQVAKGVRDAD